jgi:NADPH:quinone reductase-like Zn-dependent oxidoreductase
MLGGSKAELKLNHIVTKRLTLTGSTLRSRTVAEKGAVAEAVRKNVWPLLAQGRVRPIIHASFPMADASAAHELMESSSHIGKIILTM